MMKVTQALDITKQDCLLHEAAVHQNSGSQSMETGSSADKSGMAKAVGTKSCDRFACTTIVNQSHGLHSKRNRSGKNSIKTSVTLKA